jgi:hypothetical protein
MKNEKLVEEVTIGGNAVRLVHEDVPIDEIELDDDNPRIRYRLKMEQNGRTIEDVIRTMPEVRALQRDIERNGGLRERVILQENGSRKKAIEGNCRMVCLQGLRVKYPDDPRWGIVPARILPKDVDPKQIAILLSDFHVAGKISWKAHEKAGQVHHMHNRLGMTLEEIATYLRTSKSTVQRYLHAYGMMVDRFLKIDDEKYAGLGERKWSYFEEFFKQKDLREELKRTPDFGDDFCRWVGEGRLPEGADVRILPTILRHPDARKKFEKGAPFPEVKKVIEAAEPEQGSEFFKLLLKMKDACSSAAQVKEILKIRSDKIARQRLLDTYGALVDFMRLADVEPPEV